jgi:hypothetical protein
MSTENRFLSGVTRVSTVILTKTVPQSGTLANAPPDQGHANRNYDDDHGADRQRYDKATKANRGGYKEDTTE